MTFDAPQAALLQNAAELIMVGALTVNSGFVSLNTTNIMSGVALSGGVLAFGNAGALGAGAVSVTGGELLATASETLSNQLTFSGTSTIAAAHGTTLNENSTGYTIDGNTTLNIGSLGQDGTILWSTNSASSILMPTTDSVEVQGGTLEAADGNLSLLLGGAKRTTVATGGTIDVAGFSTTISDLIGGGAITDSGAPATLTLAAANFSGAISGPLSLVADGAIILSGANTYTGITTIDAGDSLQLGLGGAAGSIAGGAISDDGALTIDLNNNITLTNAISGAGSLSQIGTGVTSINTGQHLCRRHDPCSWNARHRRRQGAWVRRSDRYERRVSGDRVRDLRKQYQTLRLRQRSDLGGRTRHDLNPDRRPYARERQHNRRRGAR
ncbi:MAG TPA: hypothetical protein VGG77_04715 [Roseiarcus sp.]